MNSCTNCGRIVQDAYPMCQLCTDALVSELRKVPSFVVDMTITRARLDRMTSGREGGKSAETAVPVRLSADRYRERPTQRPLDMLTNEITTWARTLADHAGIDLGQAIGTRGLIQLVQNNRSGPKRDPASFSDESTYDVEQAAIWMSMHPHELRSLPGIAELHDDITNALAHVRKVIDAMPPLSYKGPCGYTWFDQGREFTCTADLRVERGEDYVRCSKCRSHYDVRDLDKRILGAMYDRLYTIGEIGSLLDELRHHVPRSTLYAWARDQVIKPMGWREKDGNVSGYWIRRSDPAVYRLGDVVHRAKDYALGHTG